MCRRPPRTDTSIPSSAADALCAARSAHRVCADTKERNILSAPHLAKLELSPEDMRRLGYRIVDQLVEYAATVERGPVAKVGSRQALDATLREPMPQDPRDPASVLQRLEREVLPYMVREAHPRFFAFIPGVSNFVGAMGDALASGYNVFAGSWLESSGPSTVELVTLDWLRDLCGLPASAGGAFVSGGSIANLTALAAARHRHLDPASWGRGVVYCSDQTHSSIGRALRLMGMAPSQARLLPSDASHRLRPEDVEDAVERDRAAGLLPFCIVANAGTTNTGAVDPLPELADLCKRLGLWLHADGAYGAAALFSTRGKVFLTGLDRVDSLSVDPHKWLFQPFACGVVLARDGETLRAAFSALPEYLKDAKRDDHGEVNLWDYGPELTRPWRALKLWLSLQVFGARAFDAAVTRGIELAETAQRAFEGAAHWRVTSPAQLAVVTVRYESPRASEEERDDLNRRIGLEITSTGFALVLSTELRGRTVLRLCTINPRTTDEDIVGTVRRLDEIARRLESAGESRVQGERGA